LLVAAMIVSVSASAQEYTFEHFVGSLGGPSSYDGVGSSAGFRFPNGVAVDRLGNVYVADTGNETIRKITPQGRVTTLAGSAQRRGESDGSGVGARFDFPYGIAVDRNGNVYVGDVNNRTIRKISTAGSVTTLAGLANSAGWSDGTGAAARFYFPSAIAVDDSGNLYVADQESHTIRKITPGGVVTTLAGTPQSSGAADGTGSAARFDSPGGVAVDAAGNVFVADSNNHTIRRMTPAGVVTTIAGAARIAGRLDGTGVNARFNVPVGIAFDAQGRLAVADFGNRTIRLVTMEGVVTTLAGNVSSPGGADGVGTSARFALPGALASDTAGNLYVADESEHTIRKIAPDALVTTLAGKESEEGAADGAGVAARFRYPAGSAIDSTGNLYIADSRNHTIRKVTPAGVVSTVAGLAGTPGTDDGPGSSARFRYPASIAIDAASTLWVTDWGNHTIRKITAGGIVSTYAGLAGSPGTANGALQAARFFNPHGIAVDRDGTLFVSEESGHTIRKITATTVTTLAGANEPGRWDGTGSGARFYSPRGVALDRNGNLYVADAGSQAIRQVSPAGEVRTVAGILGNAGAADGELSIGRLYRPAGVTVHDDGTILIADDGNRSVRKLSGGRLSTLAGPWLLDNRVGGSGNGAGFQSAASVSVDAEGNLFVVDTYAHAIHIGRPTSLPDTAVAFPAAVCGSRVQLSTTSGTADSWAWSVIRREAGSSAELSAPDVRDPTFTPERKGLYTLRLRAAGSAGVRYSTVDVVVCCDAPLTSATIAGSTAAEVCAGSGGAGWLEAAWSGGGSFVSFDWGWRATSGGTITSIGSGSDYLDVNAASLGGTGQRFIVCTMTAACGTKMVSNEVPIFVRTVPGKEILVASTAYAHSTGNVASVADAGAGATYSWSIANGSFTTSPNKATVVWTAGEVGQPTTLSVTVTNPTCQGSSSRVVSLISPVSPVTSFYTVDPCRIIDTRLPDQEQGGPSLPARGSRVVQLTGFCQIPAGAKSVSANLTVIPRGSNGHLTLYPSGLIAPLASTVNFGPGRVRANNAVVRLSEAGAVTVKSGSAEPVDFIIDVNGYFQ
jgi:sugar lactone lactonase YvrE